MEAVNLKRICSAIEDVLVTQGDLSKETAAKFKSLILLKHRHQFEGPRKIETGLTSMIKELIVKKLETSGQGTKSKEPSVNPSRRASEANVLLSGEAGERRKLPELDEGKVNRTFLKKLPSGTEGAIVLVGKTPLIQKPISVFIRLAKPVVLEDLPEVDIPTRYLYLVLGEGERLNGDVGRAIGSAFADKSFAKHIYDADNKEEIVEAFDDFCGNIKTLPRDWNSKNYIEPPAGENEKEKELQENVKDAIDDDRRNREASGLVRTGKFFGGLINDIKRHWRSEMTIFKQLKVLVGCCGVFK